jgi:tetratricopeptide (TPR) repeat protein
MNPPEGVPRVFISYSHDSPEHADRVLALADRLRAEGIDCQLDQYETSPPEGWPRWMLNQVEAADFVLVICTETYNLRFSGKAEAGKGLGVKWEGAIITQELYDAEANNTRFVPVVFSAADIAHIPIPLRGATHYDLGKSDYDSLYRRLTNQPLTPAPGLGSLRPMPAKERRHDFFPPWNVPYRRNPFFTGRDQVLEDLHNTLAEGPAAALTQVTAIAGLGGIGKTQTAVEYAYRHRDDYKAVFWIRAESDSSTTSGFLEIAGLLNLVAKDAQESVKEVIRWLGNNAGWLLLFDNADEPEKLKPFLPTDPKGHILITSRAQTFHGLARAVRLEVLAPEKALEFLLKRTEREASDGGEKGAAAQLAKELGYLPLALEQAGAFIAENSSQFRDYLASYRQQRLDLLNKAKPIAGDYKESVATTWLMNFSEIEAANPASADLLRFSAFLDPDSIPLTLVIEEREQVGPLLSAALAGADQDRLVPDTLLQPLTSYSLIRRETGSESYSVHRMVQEAVKGRMDEAQRRVWAERAVLATNAAFPDPEYANWPLCEALLPHAAAAARLVDEWNFESAQSAGLLNQLGVYKKKRGRYAEAEPLLRRSVSIFEKVLGFNHWRVGTSLNNLAQLHFSQGRYEEAEPLYHRVLSITENALGPDHPDVATGLNSLARLCSAQARYEEAEPLCSRALEITENALGPDHPEVGTSLNNLAQVRFHQGRYDEAEPLYGRALRIREKALGPNHPDVAVSLNNLAGVHWVRRRYQEAGRLCERALEIREKALGPEHPSVATSLNNLAGLYRAQERYEEAEVLYRRALEIREKALGPDHPGVANSLSNLASIYHDQKRYEEADPLQKRALGIREKALAPDHPDVGQSFNDLATLYADLGGYEKAEALFKRALTIFEQALGPDHPSTVTCRKNLRLFYEKHGRTGPPT